MHYYPFDIGNYRGDTAHLKPLEHYIYRTLIDWYYYDEKPIESENNPMVIRRLNLESEPLAEAMLLAVLGDFFVLVDGKWRHKRIDEELEAYKGKSLVNSENGKKGGRPPKKQPKKTQDESEPKPKITQSVIFANPSESEVKAIESDLKPNQESIINNQESIINLKSTIPSEPENVLLENLDELEYQTESRKIRYSQLGLTEAPDAWKTAARRKWATITDERIANEFTSFESFYGAESNRNRMETPNDWERKFIGSISKNVMSRPIDKAETPKSPAKSKGEDGKNYYGITKETIEANARAGESYYDTAKRLHDAKDQKADSTTERMAQPQRVAAFAGLERNMFLEIQKVLPKTTESEVQRIATESERTVLQVLTDMKAAATKNA